MSTTDSPQRATLAVADWRRTIGHLAVRLRDQRLRLFAVVVTMAAAGAFGLVTPRLLGSVVDLVAHGGDTADVLARAGWMAAAAIAAAACAGLGIATAASVFESVLASLREDMLEKVLGLPIARVEEVGSGDVLSRATDDVDKVGDAIGKALPSVLMSGAGVVVTLIGLAALDWRFLLVAVVTAPIYITTGRTYLRLAPPVYAEERVAAANRAHHVLGPVQGLPTVRAFDLGARLSVRIDAHSWAVVRRSMEAAVLRSRLFGRLNLAELVGMGVILCVGFVLVGDGTLTVGATTAAMLFFLAMFDPIGRLMYVLDDLQSGAAALGRIVGVLDETTPDAGDPHVGDDGSGLVAEGIRFGYTDDHLILDEVSVTIRPNEHVALVGVSGAGKSTLAAVLAGIHVPVAGTARLGGVDVAAMGDAARARRIALLTQEVHVFSGPLRDDLLLGDPDADDERVWQALEKAGAAEWVRALDDGLDTVVGEHGHEIDAMTTQQLALARIDLLDAELVIVDEATADAGSAGAGRLEQASAAVLAGRSALIIAHRLSQAAAADRIIHLDAGRVVETGSHAELVAAGGGYSEIWAAWLRGREEL
ncbi:ABC transporter ATP-binding protein/permease [Gordonia sp. HY285]|uniref:ABC transporter ATP-binding protein n=1 Tax=Gordonia liuliyuniae TaxID=2911517 RepID=UPI001F3B93BD|nr:ABC transporter ATP-binding protein [Gordonia liuliyuniae]MCF8610372.1 ABC transporter ATP-binding protein/permease [Gordonia liuliyuniae]